MVKRWLKRLGRRAGDDQRLLSELLDSAPPSTALQEYLRARWEAAAAGAETTLEPLAPVAVWRLPERRFVRSA